MQIDGAATQGEEGDDKPKNVIILGATNLPWDLDPAIIRRLDKRIRKKNHKKLNNSLFLHSEIEN